MAYFPEIPKIAYEGPKSKNPLAFKHYNPDEIVEGQSMRELLRFSVSYWHTFRGTGSDPFGAATLQRPWDDGSDSVSNACKRVEVAFEFIEKLGAPFYCFHDRDVSPEGANLAESNRIFDTVAKALKEQQDKTGIKLLWGTANLFSHPRYMHGAATSCNADVFAHAAAQVKKAIEVTHLLGGENYVFWGGREGYDTLLNTRIGQEQDQLARLLSLAIEHKNKIGFKGTLLIEPKPHEPTKHQYDRDTATVYGFLKKYGLENEVRVNIETNHATLAGNAMDHEIATAFALGIFGSIDANRGDPQNGWDTDQFWMEHLEITRSMLELLRGGGFTTGGFNFDSKVRRQSIDPADMFYGHVGSLDALARGLIAAADILEAGELDGFVADRYAGWEGPLGKWIMTDASLEAISERAVAEGLDPKPRSGRQEWLENLLNRSL